MLIVFFGVFGSSDSVIITELIPEVSPEFVSDSSRELYAAICRSEVKCS
jgi:hypothetical protein